MIPPSWWYCHRHLMWREAPCTPVCSGPDHRTVREKRLAAERRRIEGLQAEREADPYHRLANAIVGRL
ncbi:hypothetical protein GS876_21085 [Rhodococcus hoagii]|nr:hypothetical protein [Prescottella equi]MBM4687403.1 hypothetical protein [Prescottella equi]MBM4687404.1 hypothetical protein [Prescottella equi]NKU31582.1 hypothetical protein [Prescottella equi]NKU32235.1 hypothetical protein [Prescottella equi]